MIRHWRNREGGRTQEKGCMHGPARSLPPSQQQGSSLRRKAISGSSLWRKIIGERGERDFRLQSLEEDYRGERREGFQAPVSGGRL